MFGFFLQTGQTLKLVSKAIPLAEFPQMCSKGSTLRPDLLPEVSQVVPQLIKPTPTTSKIPLFVPMRMKNQNLEMIDLSSPTATSEKFCLVFYPDPEAPPHDLPIVKEYWSTIKPMIICRDVSGYYLGTPEDSGIVFFQMSVKSTSNAWIRRAVSGFTESLSYGSPIFSADQIYLQRCRSR